MLSSSSFRSQLLFLIIGLFTLVLVAVFFAVDRANQNNARIHIEEALSITSFAFQRNLTSRNQVLIDKARLLSSDFAFKEAVATNDRNTIFSALDNHRIRVDADIMLLAELDGSELISTLHKPNSNEKWPLEVLQEAAENDDNGEASGIQLIDGKPYQLVIMPLFTPEPSAWVVIGFLIKNSFSQQLSEQTNTQLSLLYKPHDNHTTSEMMSSQAAKIQWQLVSTTLDLPKQQALLSYLHKHKNDIGVNVTKTLQNSDTIRSVRLHDAVFLSRIVAVTGSGEGQTIAILQRSLDKALAPYLRLNKFMLALFTLGLLAAVMGIFYIARNLSRPLESLTETVKKIDKGEYQNQNLYSKRKDELGTLSKAVNRMSKGLQERDKVRNLLGKVVSPEIATELLSNDINLDGERKLATVLFSDIREFTSLCEGSDPEDILRLLNRYFSRMSDAIDKQHGVIDKYIGDAMMALFNVPIEIDNAPEQAVQAAQEMVHALQTLNNELIKENTPKLSIGIGIHTAQVIAGNMGSLHRSNYSVIGDGVNLASRLESLTKYFGVSIIVSESTMKYCKNIEFNELATVQVKGKKQSIRIFEPLAADELTEKHKDIHTQFQQARAYFSQQKWQQAAELFYGLLEHHAKQEKVIQEENKGTIIYQLYLDNIAVLSKQQLASNWSGELTFEHK